MEAATKGKAFPDPELLDQRKQTKPVHVHERIGPQEPSLCPWAGCNSEGVVEVRNGNGVPGVAGQGAREEAVPVVYEVGDNHLSNLVGKPGGRGQMCRGNVTRKHSLDSSSAAVPNSHGEQFDRCG